MKKKFLAAAVICSLALLSGCNSSSSSEVETTAETTPAEKVVISTNVAKFTLSRSSQFINDTTLNSIKKLLDNKDYNVGDVIDFSKIKLSDEEVEAFNSIMKSISVNGTFNSTAKTLTLNYATRITIEYTDASITIQNDLPGDK